MGTHLATTQQLDAALGRAHSRNPEALRFIVRTQISDDAGPVRVGEQSVDVVATNSPLEIRYLFASKPDDLHVIATELDDAALGEDVIARIANRKVVTLDRWESVKQLFHADRITRDLAEKAYLADALIEAAPRNGYRPVTSGVLDAEMALSRLLEANLAISPDASELVDFIDWARAPERAHRLGTLPPQVAADVDQMIVHRFGAGARAVKSIVIGGHLEDLDALAYVAAVLHHPQASNDIGGAEARVRLAGHIGADPGALAWESFARVVTQLVSDGKDRAQATARAEILLESFGGSHLAHLSDHLPSGFDQRLGQAARQLAAWRESGSTDDGDRANALIQLVGEHFDSPSPRSKRLEMAQRVIRRQTFEADWGPDLAAAAATYATEIAWLDWARTLIGRSDANPEVASLYAELIAELDTARAQANEAFVPFGAIAAGSLPEGVVGVEAVLDLVVAPVAAQAPVLLVVLDGMGWESFVEIQRHLSRAGWASVAPPDVALPAVVATLPTVTKYSRTSLLAGRLRHGTGDGEKRAFSEIASLLASSSAGKPPVVFHKADLREGGIDTLPETVRSVIADGSQQIVAVVLNNIDERLKDVPFPQGGWTLDELQPLSDLLNAARSAGRAVITTSDHGHVLDRGAEQRVHDAGGGERYKHGAAAAADETAVSGTRVFGENDQPGGTIVVPWAEQVHYGIRRNGYHGGITPQELLVPLAVFVTGGTGDDWPARTFQPPAWWRHTAPVVLPDPKTAHHTSVVAPEPANTGDRLFNPDDGGGQVAPPADWDERVLAELAELRPAGLRITDEDVRRLLRALDEYPGDAVPEPRLAELAGVPAPRLPGYIAQLQRLVNIDGYGIVTAANGEVRFDRELLERQLGLS